MSKCHIVGNHMSLFILWFNNYYEQVSIMYFMVQQMLRAYSYHVFDGSKILGADRFSMLFSSSYMLQKTIAMFFVCLQILGTDGLNLFIS